MRLLSVAVLASLLPALSLPAQASTSAGTTYYVDSRAGDDAADGTSADRAWRSLDAVNAAELGPGDTVAVKRGSSFTGSLTLSASGTARSPITVKTYGKGARPRISGRDANCVVVSGSHWRISGLRASNCLWSGFEIKGDSNVLSGVSADRNVAGVSVTPTGARNTIKDSTFADNDRMSVNDKGGDNDSGAFGILLNGDDNLVTGNTITGSHAKSHDYGVDGAAIEVFGGNRNRITHNRSHNNNTFSELGAKKGDTATGNLYAFNVVTSSLKTGSFLVTRGPRHIVGPVKGTTAVHNSVYMPARHTIGWSCHDGCSPAILKLRNNVIAVGGTAGYADGKGADEAASVYRARKAEFRLGSGSVMSDPRFVSRSNLRLAPSSPARGRAVRLGVSWFGGAALAKDFTGKPLPSSTRHAGAYQ
ncbi:right-handed parallel beta-helix repeat-containing protein [Nonomuraea sp. MCN248]|uniref:Right-handed parallel beta-helix repeat-containing protein n=1 Tax=Nonomuraea corallina TaxID=2989783 RepID=A0ABT4SI15_9ACTN|nr:right-handed parallel beta-helix repeat-containing protein [Nonomuraea corallina]MDA0636590.1 right-handed parallel beta-helix repeat-containing protein [Nonomuraea corallina]